MASLITLEAITAQEFNVTLGDYSYDIRVYSTISGMAYDLSIDDVEIVQGFQLVNEVLMLPYRYQEVDGNLLLVVPDDEVPDYESFGSTQFLYYLSAEETEDYYDSLT